MKMLKKTGLIMIIGLLFVGLQSCEDDEDVMMEPAVAQKKSSTFNYEFNNGQVISSGAYAGQHSDNLTATIVVEEVSASASKITVRLENTIDGEMYPIHAHDAADPTTTPNGTPYNETPNSAVFTKMAAGNGGTVEVSQDVDMSFSSITTMYNGFLVVHDPLQPVTTVDVSTYVILGSFARAQTATGYARMAFPYAFNTGQVAPSFAYSGTHASTLTGTVRIQELGDGTSRVSVELANTMNNQNYMVHSHDAADPATTPNMTPYNETPNGNVCTVMVSGNGGTSMASQISTLSYTNLTTMYNGFFVVHDPLQAINTADPTTYLLLGSFAR